MAWKHPKNPCRTDAPLEIQACSVPINPQTSGGGVEIAPSGIKKAGTKCCIDLKPGCKFKFSLV